MQRLRSMKLPAAALVRACLQQLRNSSLRAAFSIKIDAEYRASGLMPTADNIGFAENLPYAVLMPWTGGCSARHGRQRAYHAGFTTSTRNMSFVCAINEREVAHTGTSRGPAPIGARARVPAFSSLRRVASCLGQC